MSFNWSSGDPSASLFSSTDNFLSLPTPNEMATGNPVPSYSDVNWGGLANSVSGLAGQIYAASAANRAGNQIAQTANPFMSYMPQFASGLSTAASSGMYGAGLGANYAQLLNDPSSFLNSGMYKAAFSQGQNALNSTLAAQGLNQSGNQMAALQNYGMGQSMGLYNQYLAQQQAGNQQGFSQGALMAGLNQNSSGNAANALGQIPSMAQSGASGIGSMINSIGGIASAVGNIASFF